MSFDKPTRNKLAAMVSECRGLLTEDMRDQLQTVYGLQPDGTALAMDRLAHLDDAGKEIARELREWQEHLASTEIGTETQKKKAAFDRVAHETAFTALNRLAALRMCEERGHVIECVRRGMESDAFVLYERLSGGVFGTRGETYRIFLERMFDELAVDLGVLFDRRTPQSLVFPRERCLEEVLSLLNSPRLTHLWKEDEAIGWIYQYFNSKEEREAMREASGAPRNSRELAVRNQFFTPRYVVEFLVDNTLGRIWYEMRKGDTTLSDICHYLVRRPFEIFLKEGEEPPELPNGQDDLSREELLKHPVYIRYRPKKDPRDLKILDPACGSGHFLLYAFDLLEMIYAETWADDQPTALKATGKTLREDYPKLDDLKCALPELILRHNLHGIDIDLRACQIAALALWLRAQRAYQCIGLKPADRPEITKSNIACAEPMPGEKQLLDQFVAELQPKALGQLLQVVFEKMKLAGETGSLLKIEEEIAGAIADAKKKWLAGPKPEQRVLFGDMRPQQTELNFDFSGIDNETFWERAEERIYAELQHYAERAENGHSYQRRLFVDDAARGFAFIDLSRKRYDVVLMNPPFGDASIPSKGYIEENYGDTRGDVYKAFVECFQARLGPANYLGIISSRTGFFLGQSEDWRIRVVLRLFRPVVLADLGVGVLDAAVEVACYVLRSLSASETRALTLSLVSVLTELPLDKQRRFSLPKWQEARGGLKRYQALAELEELESAGFVLRCAGDIVRYSPVWENVRSAPQSAPPTYPQLVCIRALVEDDKSKVLASATRDPQTRAVFVCNPEGFSVVPTSPFSYWVPQRFRNLFAQLEPLQGNGRYACVTNPLGENFRYIRTSWEVPPSLIGREGRWIPFAKGGSYSPHYSDLHLVVDWDKKRETYRGFLGTQHRPLARPASVEHFFRPGLTWARRADGLSFRVLPAGSIFSDKGPALFCDADDRETLLSVCAVLSSTAFKALIAIQLGRVSLAQSYEVGLVQQTPFPKLNPQDIRKLENTVLRIWTEKCQADSAKLTAHPFVLPGVLTCTGTTLAERADAWSSRVRKSEEAVAAIQTEIDAGVLHFYGLNAADFGFLSDPSKDVPSSTPECEAKNEDEEDVSEPESLKTLTVDLVEYTLGCAFGRWNVRFAINEQPAPELPEPVAPLPAIPPGMLQNEQGLPLTKDDVECLRARRQWQYPLEIPWDGILVDDPDHEGDVVRRVRKVLSVIWADRADAIEQEACEVLGVRGLREYFRKPSLFFADHRKGHSKSQRQAPIYWPVSTASGSYTLWIYYQRLNDDLLFTALNKYVKPKIDAMEKELRRIESELPNAMGRESSALRTAFERATSFLEELHEFRDELARVAQLSYKPNLNDGVLITASPLWRLFRLPRWRRDLEECWKKLEGGEYEWAHLAYSIWPDRVRKVCSQDRSIAIAHGLEELCETTAKSAKKRRAKKEEIEETVLGDEK
jgi:hypothetical protein